MTATPNAKVMTRNIAVQVYDGSTMDLIVVAPAHPVAALLWVPALGVAARHYLGFAEALASSGIAAVLHEARGTGSSSLRASRRHDWGYREIIELDIPAAMDAASAAFPALPFIIGGHSIGGQFAALAAALRPGTVGGIAIVASGLPYWKTFRSSQRWLLRSLQPVVALVTAMCGFYPGRRLGFAGNEAKTLMRDWTRTVSSGRYAPRAMRSDLDGLMQELQRPVLAIGLADDRLCPPASLEALLEKFSAASIERAHCSAKDFASASATHFSWMKDSAPIVLILRDWVERRIVASR